MSPTLLITVLASAAIVPALLLTLQTYEFWRFTRSRVKHPNAKPSVGRPMVIIPCKGAEANLTDNLRPFFAQDHTDYQLRFVVENEADGAYSMLSQLIREHRNIDAEIVLAGVARSSGQKVHNLRMATAMLPRDVTHLAFADSDARPSHGWLRQLVQHLDTPNTAASTAYRWFVPTRVSLPNMILASINASVASLVGPGKHHMVWGGAWAIRRDCFERIQLRDAWQGTISDDLVAARTLAKHKLKIEFEPACMSASRVDMTWSQLGEFVTRQYAIAKFYTPNTWAAAMLCCTASQAVMLTSLVGAFVNVMAGSPKAWLPLASFSTLYLTHFVRAALRQNAAKTFCQERTLPLAIAARFDLWLAPFAAIFNWGYLATSLFKQTIVWRGNQYRLFPGGAFRLMNRAETKSTTNLTRRFDAGVGSLDAKSPTAKQVHQR